MDFDSPILVVDDDVVTRTIIEKYLKKAGFDVQTAANGREALDLLETCDARIILTDWMMPEIDGPQLCRRIREKTIDHYIFIILITARDSKNDIVSGLESGADDYLTKPIHPAELVARIHTGIRILELEQSLKSANEEIRLLSITDPLTGAYNRGYLVERFNQELSRSQRYQHDLSLFLLDLDFFKKVNDNYGHQVGDLVLKNFSRCITEQLRTEIDWIVRYGGEEFLIVLPETRFQDSLSIAERLRQTVEQLEIQVLGLNQPIHITASFGGVNIGFEQNPTMKVTLETAIHKADELLYRSKREGRNKVNIEELIPIVAT